MAKRHVVPTHVARPRRGSVAARHRPRLRPDSRRLRRPRSARTAARQPAAPPRLPSSGPASHTRAPTRRAHWRRHSRELGFRGRDASAVFVRTRGTQSDRKMRKRDARNETPEKTRRSNNIATPSLRSHDTLASLASLNPPFTPPPAFPAPPRRPARAPPRLSTPPPARTRRVRVCSLAKPPPRAPR